MFSNFIYVHIFFLFFLSNKGPFHLDLEIFFIFFFFLFPYLHYEIGLYMQVANQHKC